MHGHALMSLIAAAGVHADPVAPVVLALAVILVAAKFGGDLAARIGQPSVLGELAVGVVLGNLTLAGFHGFEVIKNDSPTFIISPTVDSNPTSNSRISTPMRESMSIVPSFLMTSNP